MATTFLQALEVVHGSSRASWASKNGGRWRQVLLVLGLSFDTQETHQNRELKLRLGFRFLDEKLMSIGPPFIGVLVPNHRWQRS
jgi:hypothetical protein